MAAWKPRQRQVMTRAEMKAILDDLDRRSRRSINTRMNLVIFRLAACCGLRVGEICGLRMANVKLGGTNPRIYIPKSISKTKQSREVTLAWNQSTRIVLEQWKAKRQEQGATSNDPFVCAQSTGKARRRIARTTKVGGEWRREIAPTEATTTPFGKPLTRNNAAMRFKSAIRPGLVKLYGEADGRARADELHIHCGRHSFVSHALHMRDPQEVQEAAGHSTLATTGRYAHIIIDPEKEPEDVFDFAD